MNQAQNILSNILLGNVDLRFSSLTLALKEGFRTSVIIVNICTKLFQNALMDERVMDWTENIRPIS
jgi:hypothetical protein